MLNDEHVLFQNDRNVHEANKVVTAGKPQGESTVFDL